MLTARWHGSDLVVRARAVPRYLWTTVSIDVLIDGAPVLRTGGERRSRGSATSEFRHDGAWYVAELSWGTFANGGFPFMLRIDKEIVLAAEVPVENLFVVGVGWAMAVLIVLILVSAGFRLLT